MSNFQPLERSQFDKVIDTLNNSGSLNKNLIYEIYETACSGISQLIDAGPIFDARTINPLEIIYYSVGEYIYTTSGRSAEEQDQLITDEKYVTSVASIIADKYLSLSMFNHAEVKLANKYIPPISSINLYLNFMLNIIQSFRKNDPKLSLINDLFLKSVSISRCILQLLTGGYETEAFSCWRTLHECECTLLLLDKYGDDLINRYLLHMQYGIVYRKEDLTDEKGNALFAQMKEEMKTHNLKSKDIKKYIEYGWLYQIPGVNEDENFKLNFRDGLEKLADLSSYAGRYEMSSEIIHSTPLLIYSKKEYFYFVTLLSLYESFFRLEKVFISIFTKYVSKEQMDHYVRMRKLYYSQLVNIHRRESAKFLNWQKEVDNTKKAA